MKTEIINLFPKPKSAADFIRDFRELHGELLRIIEPTPSIETVEDLQRAYPELFGDDFECGQEPKGDEYE